MIMVWRLDGLGGAGGGEEAEGAGGPATASTSAATAEPSPSSGSQGGKGAARGGRQAPPELLFQHAGHRDRLGGVSGGGGGRQGYAVSLTWWGRGEAGLHGIPHPVGEGGGRATWYPSPGGGGGRQGYAVSPTCE